RELPEEGPRLAAEGEDAARVEVGQRPFRPPELEVVGHEPAALDREDEAADRRLRRPAAEHVRVLQAVERVGELDRVEEAARVPEPLPAREVRGVEGPAPAGIVVAADADADAAAAHL